MAKRSHLPIDDCIEQIAETLTKHNNLVITAAPGAGKTTRVPARLAQLTNKQVWVLEPRRIAAISAASRIAEENEWQLGHQVGYQVRFESQHREDTQVLFLTEALLVRKLKKDPLLKKVGIVVLDEFHERSLNVDMALACLKELQSLERNDLKIVVMSATLDAQAVSRYLENAPVVEVPGRLFPQTVHYQEKTQLLRTDFDFIERMAKLILKARQQNPVGHLLCFLPGKGEIFRLEKFLNEKNEGFNVYPLHGQLSLAEQREVLFSTKESKIILATNIAESALTIEGVRTVVDSGLVRIQQQNLTTLFDSLVLSRVSKASSTQRAGRSARLGPGVVYRAWTQIEQSSLKDFEVPEIERVDLSESLLLLASLGISHWKGFSWYSAPSERSLASAIDFLQSIKAFDNDGKITQLGLRLSEISLHPRLALLLLEGQKKECLTLSIELAALLSEGDRQFVLQNIENDVFCLWSEWKENRKKNPNIEKSIRQLQSLFLVKEENQKIMVTSDQVAELLLTVYPDRLCRRRSKESMDGKMVGGRGVSLSSSTTVKLADYFLAIETKDVVGKSNSQVSLAVGLREDQVKSYFKDELTNTKQTEWDESVKKFWIIESEGWKDLMIGPIHKRSPRSEEIVNALVDLIMNRWESFLSNNEGLLGWFQKLQFLHKKDPQYSLLQSSQIRNAVELACYGETTLEAVAKKDLIYFFEQQLPSSHQQILHQSCPTYWVAPTNRKFSIQYSLDQGPFVEVRLQELFGLQQSPVVLNEPLTFFILAPNYRPVQVTKDLASFWKNAYPEIRKEMRARYPKHAWPENPLLASPEAKGRSHR